MTANYYVNNAAKDIFHAVKSKNGQDFLPWANAWQELLATDVKANWNIVMPEERDDQGNLVRVSTTMHTPYGHFVEVQVSTQGETVSILQPVFDYKNKAIENPNPNDVNRSIHRALAKAIALQGIGIGVFTGDKSPIDAEFMDYNTKRKSIKGKGEYLPWVWAWDALKRRDEKANYQVVRFGENKFPYYADSTGFFVMVEVTFQGIARREILPILNTSNKPVSENDLTVMEINKAIQRCLTKAIAFHGIGLELYAGEDLPEGDSEEDDGAAAKKKNDMDANKAKTMSKEQALAEIRARSLAAKAKKDDQASSVEIPETSSTVSEDTTAAQESVAEEKTIEVNEPVAEIPEEVPSEVADVNIPEVASEASESQAESASEPEANSKVEPVEGLNEEQQKALDRLLARLKANPKSAPSLLRIAKGMVGDAGVEILKAEVAKV